MKDIGALCAAAKDLVMPKDTVCLGCGDRTGLDHGPWLCDRCARRLTPAYHEIAPARLRDGLSKSWFGVSYERPAAGVIKAVKFGGVWRAAPFLAGLLRPVFESGALKGFDALVPVPLHPSRRRDRGFDQAESIARALADLTGIPVRTDLLRRVKKTRAQAKTDYHRRAANVSGAFDCPGRADGLSLLLVDDVYTTGSTLSACALALRRSGARNVSAVTVAGSRYFRLHPGLVLYRPSAAATRR